MTETEQLVKSIWGHFEKVGYPNFQQQWAGPIFLNTPVKSLSFLVHHLGHEIIEDIHKQDGTSNDKIFEGIMSLFDILDDKKHIIQDILESFLTNPQTAYSVKNVYTKTMDSFLKACGLKLTFIKKMGFYTGFLYVLYAWLNDDSADQAHTMRKLDETLKLIDTVENKFPHFNR